VFNSHSFNTNTILPDRLFVVVPLSSSLTSRDHLASSSAIAFAFPDSCSTSPSSAPLIVDQSPLFPTQTRVGAEWISRRCLSALSFEVWSQSPSWLRLELQLSVCSTVSELRNSGSLEKLSLLCIGALS
ncbi:hypothetical protein Drorol1_Dr00008467, partial [Drosera rotundifolia]